MDAIKLFELNDDILREVFAFLDFRDVQNFEKSGVRNCRGTTGLGKQFLIEHGFILDYVPLREATGYYVLQYRIAGKHVCLQNISNKLVKVIRSAEASHFFKTNVETLTISFERNQCDWKLIDLFTNLKRLVIECDGFDAGLVDSLCSINCQDLTSMAMFGILSYNPTYQCPTRVLPQLDHNLLIVGRFTSLRCLTLDAIVWSEDLLMVLQSLQLLDTFHFAFGGFLGEVLVYFSDNNDIMQEMYDEGIRVDWEELAKTCQRMPNLTTLSSGSYYLIHALSFLAPNITDLYFTTSWRREKLWASRLYPLAERLPKLKKLHTGSTVTVTADLWIALTRHWKDLQELDIRKLQIVSSCGSALRALSNSPPLLTLHTLKIVTYNYDSRQPYIEVVLLNALSRTYPNVKHLEFTGRAQAEAIVKFEQLETLTITRPPQRTHPSPHNVEDFNSLCMGGQVTMLREFHYIAQEDSKINASITPWQFLLLSNPMLEDFKVHGIKYLDKSLLVALHGLSTKLKVLDLQCYSHCDGIAKTIHNMFKYMSTLRKITIEFVQDDYQEVMEEWEAKQSESKVVKVSLHPALNRLVVFLAKT